MGPMCCPEISVTNYQLTPRSIPEQRRPHLHLSLSIKCCMFNACKAEFVHIDSYNAKILESKILFPIYLSEKYRSIFFVWYEVLG
jgi:hypothetical protein